jgi:hypothetical protein
MPDSIRRLLNKTFFPSRGKKRSTDPGHFYSPLPDPDEIRRDEARIFGSMPRTIAGIDLNEEEQLALLSSFVDYYRSLPFGERPSPNLRYGFDNPAYSYSDAIMLHCMIRHVRPHRIIEVGSGYSSCVTLDTNELFFDNRIRTTFIEPYPELLLSLVKEGDRSRIRVIPSRLQDVAPEEFEALEENDILFVDSTHVCKTGSDVNCLFFDILPRLRKGVHVHFHDIFFPFEYPKEWIYRGRAWNEAYLLRAFLQYNAAFRVVLMNTFMQHFHAGFFRENMPLCLKNPGGSIWLRRQ